MWIQAGAILSAASCLAWIARLFGATEAELLAPLGLRPQAPSPVSFLPYLSGERTPHDDPAVRGMLDGLSHGTDRGSIVQAVLEGVAFALADCRDALADAGIADDGSRRHWRWFTVGFWLSVLANVLNVPVHRFAGGETGAAFGAARLGRLAVTGEAIAAVCTAPERIETFEPERTLAMPMPSGFPHGAPVSAAALIVIRDDVAKKRHHARDRFRLQKIKASPDRSRHSGFGIALRRGLLFNARTARQGPTRRG